MKSINVFINEKLILSKTNIRRINNINDIVNFLYDIDLLIDDYVADDFSSYKRYLNSSNKHMTFYTTNSVNANLSIDDIEKNIKEYSLDKEVKAFKDNTGKYFYILIDASMLIIERDITININHLICTEDIYKAIMG